MRRLGAQILHHDWPAVDFLINENMCLGLKRRLGVLALRISSRSGLLKAKFCKTTTDIVWLGGEVGPLTLSYLNSPKLALHHCAWQMNRFPGCSLTRDNTLSAVPMKGLHTRSCSTPVAQGPDHPHSAHIANSSPRRFRQASLSLHRKTTRHRLPAGLQQLACQFQPQVIGCADALHRSV